MATGNLDEESKVQHLTGYPSLAAFIASDTDKTTAIFKRFDELAVRNLLYLQSELAELQWKQRCFDQEDARSDMDTKQCARNWEAFRRTAAQPDDTRQKDRMELMRQIRQNMKEYREALLFESTLASIPPPSKRVLNAFRLDFFNGPRDSKTSFPTLGGHSADLYDNIDDLVALRVQEDQDRLTTFVQDRLGCLFPARPSERGIAYASDRAISSFIAWFSTLLAAVLLIGAIVVLYKVQPPKWRLGLIAAFTSLFAGSVGLLTNARRAELFGATAAYAAVLVVFVSGNLGEVPSS
ncbi:hypothetical protein BDV96DRAFT_506453 [Lophiotrema nucula]|uniref:DUF6594 domain-containing protein n=1 Tax=Lophiotrema nucula TaxID=690887 RepID=A0A6A5YLT1_9PLEO|nr:hypothetical protein BDV96DRAFT_506453 [Lophiotrema nucula]